MRIRSVPALAAGLCFAVMAACSGDSGTGPNPSPTPVAGPLTVALTAPDTLGGALMFEVSGGPVSSVTAGAGYLLYSAQIDSVHTRIVVAGGLTSGTVAQLGVPDVARLSQYHLQVMQVANRVSYAPLPIGSYRLTLAP